MNIILESKIYLAVIYILLGMTIYFILKKVTKRLTKNIKINDIANKRKNTIISLINNLIKYLIAIFIILSILSAYGIDISSILASLGIVAVVVGLAFQDIAKDLLSGIFIIFDNQYSVGDMVEINDFTGEVISLGLRTTKIKSFTGEVLIISNSLINEVINYNLESTNLIIDLNVAYNTNIDKLENVLLSLNEDIKNYEEVKGELQLLGINEFANSSIVYKILIECKPTTQYGLKRKMLKLIKKEFDKNNIEIVCNKLDINVRN